MDVLRVDISSELAPLVDAVERGESVEILRDGKAVAAVHRLDLGEPAATPTGNSLDWLDKLEAIQALIPLAARGGRDTVRRMRDEGY